MKFRVAYGIRVKGQSHFCWGELKSEDFDSLEDLAEAIKESVMQNIDEYIGDEEYGDTD